MNFEKYITDNHFQKFESHMSNNIHTMVFHSETHHKYALVYYIPVWANELYSNITHFLDFNTSVCDEILKEYIYRDEPIELVGIGYGAVVALSLYQSIDTNLCERISKIIIVNSDINDELYSEKLCHIQEKQSVHHSVLNYDANQPFHDQSLEFIMSFIQHESDAHHVLSNIDKYAEFSHIRRMVEFCNNNLYVCFDSIQKKYYLIHYNSNQLEDLLESVVYLSGNFQHSDNRLTELVTATTLRCIWGTMSAESSICLIGVGYKALSTIQSLPYCYKNYIDNIILFNPIVKSIPEIEKITVRHEPSTVTFLLSLINYQTQNVMKNLIDALVLYMISETDKSILIDKILSTKCDDVFLTEVIDKLNDSVIKMDEYADDIKKDYFSKYIDADSPLPNPICDYSSKQAKILKLIEYINSHTEVNHENMIKFIRELTSQKGGSVDHSHIYFKILEERVVCKIEEYLLLFRAGDFDKLSEIYSIPEHIALSSVVYNVNTQAYNALPCHIYGTFKKYISWAYKTLDGLSKATILWKEYQAAKRTAEKYQLDSETLRDMSKLEEYIKGLKEKRIRDKFLLGETNISLSVAPKIRPEVKEYIKRYNIPEDGLFDAEKMANVIEYLENKQCSDSDDDTDSVISNTLSSCLSPSSDHCVSDSECSDSETSYYVYNFIADDPFHAQNTFYYPLFLNEIKCGVKYTFVQHPGVTFWMPPTNGFVATHSPPETCLEYILYTNSCEQTFELGNLTSDHILNGTPNLPPDVSGDGVQPDAVLHITWERTSTFDWSKLFLVQSESNTLECIYEKPLKFITNKHEWKPFQFTKEPGIEGELSIADDFINHIATCVYGDPSFKLFIQNKIAIKKEIWDIDVNEHVRTVLKKSSCTTEYGDALLPYVILSHLARDANQGHARLRSLLESRNGNLHMPFTLLQSGDRIVFYITLHPSNDGIVDNSDNVITSRTYKIFLKLI